MDPRAIIAATSRTRSGLQNQASPVADAFDLARFDRGFFDLDPFDQWMRLADSLLNRLRPDMNSIPKTPCVRTI